MDQNHLCLFARSSESKDGLYLHMVEVAMQDMEVNQNHFYLISHASLLSELRANIEIAMIKKSK